MKVKFATIAAASGKQGGVVFSHNRGGTYTRLLAIPVNPNTPQQQQVRGTMTFLAATWKETLTPAERTGWETYALNTPITDRLGESIILPPMSWYVACNTQRAQAGLARIDTPPILFGLAAFSPPTLTTASVATQLLSFTFSNSEAWATAVGGALLVYISRPVSPSIGFFKGPYRYAGAVLGAVVPPTSPGSVAVPFPIALTQRIFARLAVTQADGRKSESWRGFLNVTA